MTIIPGKLDLTIYRGATFPKPLVWNDESNNPVNLTGWTARLMMRETIDSESPFQTLTTENGGITIDGETGTINLLISATDTAEIRVTQGVYDLEMTAPDGETVVRLLEGNVLVVPGVTR